MPELKEIAIEEVLGRHLGQVSAPEDLWRRIQNGGATRQRPVSRRVAWALVAAMFAGGAAWALHPRPDAGIRSSNAAEIRAWVKARTDLEVPLRDSSPVRLIGAHVTNHGSAAEIAYRAGGHKGTLSVARAPGSMDTHAPGERLSWTMHGQAYAIACEDPHAACLLCHS